MCYIIAEGFFLYYHFSLVISYHSVWLGLELFGLVHVQGEHIEYSSRSYTEDVTIRNVIIKTPGRTGVWMTSCPEARGGEFWWFLKKAVSWDLSLGEIGWDSDLGEASPVVVYGMRCAFVGSVSWDSDSGPRVQLGSWLKGDVGTVSVVKIVCLSPRVEKLKVKKS